MADDFSDGWIEFQEFIDNLRCQNNLSIADIKQYFKMYIEDEE